MDITLLPPTSILANHSHLTLLPSPISPPRRHSPLSPYVPTSHPRLSTSYRSKRSSPSHCPDPPMDGSSPISTLPDELLTHIFSYLEWDHILALRPTCSKWADVALSPNLHHSLTLLSLPPTPLPVSLRRTIKHLRHLHLHLFPYPTPIPGSTHPTTALISLLNALPPNQLISLSLPFSAPYLPGSDLGEILKRIGGKLEYLDLRGSGLVGSKWTHWIKHIGNEGDGLKYLDLSFTSISTLPGITNPDPDSMSPAAIFRSQRHRARSWYHHGLAPPRSPELPEAAPSKTNEPVEAFRNLRHLSLSSCAYLPEQVLNDFLLDLPSNLERLDISRLEAVSFEALWDLKVTQGPNAEDTQSNTPDYLSWSSGDTAESSSQPTELSEIKVVGIDHLTRLDIRRLKRHWEDQRKACFPEPLFSPVEESMEPIFEPLQPKTPRTPPQQMMNLPLSPPETPSPSSSRSPSASRSASKSDLRSEPIYCPTPSRSSFENHPFSGAGKVVHDLPTPPSAEAEIKKQKLDQGDYSENEWEINVVHSAILESEDEEGYRRFIGEVAGGVVPPTWGHGHMSGLALASVTGAGGGEVILPGQEHAGDQLVAVDGGHLM